MDDAAEQERILAVAYPRLVAALALATGRRATAEDLAHDAVVRYLSRWETTKDLDRPEAWLYRVGLNLARSRWRRMRTERRTLDRLGGLSEWATAAGDDSIGGTDVWGALDLLTQRQRQAVVGRYFLDMSSTELGQAIGCRPATAKTHLRDALVRLRSSGLTPDTEQEDLTNG